MLKMQAKPLLVFNIAHISVEKLCQMPQICI